MEIYEYLFFSDAFCLETMALYDSLYNSRQEDATHMNGVQSVDTNKKRKTISAETYIWYANESSNNETFYYHSNDITIIT